MAPPPGTMRVSRYFVALGLVLGVLYLLVLLPGNANTPKLGIDLVGGIRVIFTATPPPGEQITGTAMEQARQIIEDRINGTGVTASTVQIQGDDQLVVSIPGGTDTDVQRLGQAAQLNFRPQIAPIGAVQCNQNPKAKTISSLPAAGSGASSAPSGSATSAPTGAASTTPSSAASTPRAGAPSSESAAPNDAAARKLAPTSATASAPTAARTNAPTSPSRGSTPASGTATAPASQPAAQTPTTNQPCLTNAPKIVQGVFTKATNNATTAQLAKSLKSDPAYYEKLYSKLSQADKTTVAQALSRLRCDTVSTTQPDRATGVYVACDEQKQRTYLLGQVIVRGTQIDEANANAPSTGGQGGSQVWTVSLNLDDSGQKVWGDWTTAHNTSKSESADPSSCGLSAQFPCNDWVAFTLDGQVKSAPATNEPIIGQTTQITGNFTQTTANDLADQLKFGALPLNFKADSNERVSASLGTSQLQAAFLAGGIGLALVVIYSLLYYRGLGLVTIASLIVSGLLTYALIVILGQQIGFTLDLAGIAGLIVALGITADSFVVFFERIKDEVHEGRSVRVAVPRGWVRARRTVISADVVSFLAAVILYVFASADVKGFAFTLGLSTILDLLVVVVFTHPMVALLSRSRAFGSPRFTGLNSVRVGGVTQDADRPRAKLAARVGQRSAAERAASRRGRTVTLDKPDEDTEVTTDEVLSEPGADVQDAAVDAAVDETDIADTTESEAEDTTEAGAAGAAGAAGRAGPAGGSAAERAAARRARLRRQRDEKGE